MPSVTEAESNRVGFYPTLPSPPQQYMNLTKSHMNQLSIPHLSQRHVADSDLSLSDTSSDGSIATGVSIATGGEGGAASSGGGGQKVSTRICTR